MKEEFLHYIWKYRLFTTEYLYFNNQKIEVLEIGEHNQSSGPDFFNSKIKIGETIWVGNVEIHVKASDWHRHGHQKDPAYENVILHMVFENDKQIFRSNGEEIPSGRITFNPEILARYKELIRLEENKECFSYFAKMEKVIYYDWLEKLEFMRLERKMQIVTEILKRNHYHWDAALYEMLAMAVGMKLNAVPFRLLTQAVPLEFTLKKRNKIISLLAAFYGKAGFLENENSFLKYNILTKEYTALKHLLPKTYLNHQSWKKMRARPTGFPEIRIAQFINLVINIFPFFEKLKACENVNNLREIIVLGIKNNFNEISELLGNDKILKSNPGKKTIDSIIINSIVPFLFYYGKFTNKEAVKQNSIKILEDLPAENNEIIKKWNKFGIVAENAFDSQALIELKTQFCHKQRCMECMIGHQILSIEENK
ncbi:MAG: DUF2851 family protein [Bacteroidales bacterium]|nr:DUF2851 family protein [Bacteroidales bacterium]